MIIGVRRALVTCLGLLLASTALVAGSASAAARTVELQSTVTVNIRAAANTTSAIVGRLDQGQAINAVARGRAWTRVVFRGQQAFVATRYLTTRTVALRSAVEPGSVRVTTANLNVRRGPGRSYAALGVLVEGTAATLSGRSSGEFVEVTSGALRGWASLRYLAHVVGLPAVGLPAVIGVRYATVALDVRSTSADNYTRITTVAKGTELSVTGVEERGRAQIVFNGAVAWVTAKYLSVTPVAGPYAVEKGLTPNAIKVHRAAMARFPEITTYYGVRKDSQPDHPSGRALDLMIPNYKTKAGKALGSDVAAWARVNALALGIRYVIWNQHIWNIQRDSEGWRRMPDRGGDSANHRNHVHITVFA